MTPNAASDGRQTLMAQEAGEAATAVAAMLAANREAFAAIGQRLRTAPPVAVVTCARGSSDHAATYAKYLVETMTGTPTASAALSIARSITPGVAAWIWAMSSPVAG